MHKVTTHLRHKSTKNAKTELLTEVSPGEDVLKNIMQFATLYRAGKIQGNHYISIMIN